MGKKKADKDEGMSLDDAFADDDDVEYAETKPNKKLVKKVEKTTGSDSDNIKLKSSKPISKIKEGDKIKVDSITLEVDEQVELIDHGTTKEIAIECHDAKNKDSFYQIRYFSDQVETSLEVYEWKEIMFSRMRAKKVEW
ncbi:MAG: hypothetical protein ABH864_00315 [archaeon]